MSDGGGIVTATVADSVLGGQLVDGEVDHRLLIGTGVGMWIANSQYGVQGVAGRLEEPVHAM